MSTYIIKEKTLVTLKIKDSRQLGNMAVEKQLKYDVILNIK